VQLVKSVQFQQLQGNAMISGKDQEAAPEI